MQPPGPLNLIAATNFSFDGASGESDFEFDTTAEAPLLDAGGASAAKWSVRFEGTRYVGVTIAKTGYNVLHVTFTATGPEAGIDVCGYTNAPSDISDALGRQLAAFADFPL